MKLGIVGLPNVGKPTLFNALTNAGAESANYPFCTIEPNVDAATVELQVRQSKNFRDRFFGKLASVLPSEKMLAFENKWRETHIALGPVTKGSSISTEKITRQI